MLDFCNIIIITIQLPQVFLRVIRFFELAIFNTADIVLNNYWKGIDKNSFFQVEQFIYSSPEKSWECFDEMIEVAEQFYQVRTKLRCSFVFLVRREIVLLVNSYILSVYGIFELTYPVRLAMPVSAWSEFICVLHSSLSFFCFNQLKHTYSPCILQANIQVAFGAYGVGGLHAYVIAPGVD